VEFEILTRSLTPLTPPASCEELTSIALTLRERVSLPPAQLYRLVGVGSSNFRDEAESPSRCSFQRTTLRIAEEQQGNVSR